MLNMYYSYWVIPECAGDTDNIIFKMFNFHNSLNWEKNYLNRMKTKTLFKKIKKLIKLTTFQIYKWVLILFL